MAKHRLSNNERLVQNASTTILNLGRYASCSYWLLDVSIDVKSDIER